MATHSYSKSRGGSISGNGSTKTYTTDAFTIKASEEYYRIKVTTNNSTPRLYGSSLDFFGSLDTWKTSTPPSGIWKSGNGASVKFINSSASVQSMTVTVHWETKDKATYTVSCATTGSGTLTCSPSNTYWGNTITLSPSAATGWQLSSYSTSPSVTISNNTFTLPKSNVTVTANFTRRSYTLSLSHNGGSGNNFGTLTGAGTYTYQSTVNISVTENISGWRFDHWVVSGPGTIGSTTSPSTTFTMGAGNASIQAIFVTSRVSTYIPTSDYTWSTTQGKLTLSGTMINTTTYANAIREPVTLKIILGKKES